MSNSLHKRLDKLEGKRIPKIRKDQRPFRVATIFADGVGLYLIHRNKYYFFCSEDIYREYVNTFYPQKGAIRECRMYPDGRESSLEDRENIVSGWDAEGNLSTSNQ